MHESQDNGKHVIITQSMMQNAARGCVRTMEILLNENQSELTSWHVPFYILATTALEIFPKIVLLRYKKNNESIQEIDKEFRKFGHRLDLLYSKDEVGSDFLSNAGIDRVEEKEPEDDDQFVYRFDFYLKNNGKNPIQVYHMNSLRYGLMAGQKNNVGVVAYQFEELLGLCKSVEMAVICYNQVNETNKRSHT